MTHNKFVFDRNSYFHERCALIACSVVTKDHLVQMLKFEFVSGQIGMLAELQQAHSVENQRLQFEIRKLKDKVKIFQVDIKYSKPFKKGRMLHSPKVGVKNGVPDLCCFP